MDKYSKSYYEHLEQNLYSAVVSNCLDGLGYWNQSMSSNVRPLDPNKVMVGRAKTVQATEVNRTPDKPYEKLIEVMDSIEHGDIITVSLAGSQRSGFFGELLGTLTQASEGRGAVMDGSIRDARQLKEMGFPIFSHGFRPTDSFGRNDVVEYGNAIECGGVTVEQGDLIIGDIDGVVVVPADVEDEVVKSALEIVEQENYMRDDLRDGMSLADAFKKYGLL